LLWSMLTVYMMRSLCLILAYEVVALRESGHFANLKTSAYPRSSLSILTWNVENFGSNSLASKEDYVHKQLNSIYLQQKPEIFVLQEVESCRSIERFYRTKDYGCVTSTVSKTREQKTPMVLGNVVLYSQAHFRATNENRAMEEGIDHLPDQITPLSGRSLRNHWKEECEFWRAYRDCRSIMDDMQRPTTVLLTLRSDTGLWKEEVMDAFSSGVRIVDVHLFSGVRQKLTDEGRRKRRKFQMRSLLAMVTDWNRDMERVPTTIYAGDFNTRGSLELRDITAAAEDYGLKLWCPANHEKDDRYGGSCSRTKSTHQTSGDSFLDNFVVDLQPERGLAGSRAKAEVLKQPTNAQQRSDHEPFLLTFLPAVKNLKAPASWPTLSTLSSLGKKSDDLKPVNLPEVQNFQPLVGGRYMGKVKFWNQKAKIPFGFITSDSLGNDIYFNQSGFAKNQRVAFTFEDNEGTAIAIKVESYE